jgi:hypothetical protein
MLSLPFFPPAVEGGAARRRMLSHRRPAGREGKRGEWEERRRGVEWEREVGGEERAEGEMCAGAVKSGGPVQVKIRVRMA